MKLGPCTWYTCLWRPRPLLPRQEVVEQHVLERLEAEAHALGDGLRRVSSKHQAVTRPGAQVAAGGRG